MIGSIVRLPLELLFSPDLLDAEQVLEVRPLRAARRRCVWSEIAIRN